MGPLQLLGSLASRADDPRVGAPCLFGLGWRPFQQPEPPACRADDSGVGATASDGLSFILDDSDNLAGNPDFTSIISKRGDWKTYRRPCLPLVDDMLFLLAGACNVFEEFAPD